MKSLSRGGILWTFLSSPILMKSLRLSLITSLCASYVVKPPLVAFPTLWDCSLLVSDAELLAEVLLEDEDPICLATLPPGLPVDEEDSPSDEDELLTDDDLSEEERLTEDELLTDEDDLSEDEFLTVVPLLLLLLSCEPRETLVEDPRLLS